MVDASTLARGLMDASRAALDQRDLVERAGRGDHDAFSALVGATIAELEAVARLILRDHELARDAVQDAYIKAWRDLPGLREPDRFEAGEPRLNRLVLLEKRERVADARREQVGHGTVAPFDREDLGLEA